MNHPKLRVIGIGSYDHKDLEAKGQLYYVGARFEALFMGVLTAVSYLGCIFFRILTSGLEQFVERILRLCRLFFVQNQITQF